MAKVFKYKVSDYMKINEKAKKGLPHRVGETCVIVKTLDDGSLYDYEVMFTKDSEKSVVKEEELDPIERDTGKFEKIGWEIGKFTDMKNKQYGSSVDVAYEMTKVLMNRYAYDEEHYLIPKSLLPHLLLITRMMDKLNRIFNNPSGKGDSESPYVDLTGYSIIGVDMVNRLKKSMEGK